MIENQVARGTRVAVQVDVAVCVAEDSKIPLRTGIRIDVERDESGGVQEAGEGRGGCEPTGSRAGVEQDLAPDEIIDSQIEIAVAVEINQHAATRNVTVPQIDRLDRARGKHRAVGGVGGESPDWSVCQACTT